MTHQEKVRNELFQLVADSLVGRDVLLSKLFLVVERTVYNIAYVREDDDSKITITAWVPETAKDVASITIQ